MNEEVLAEYCTEWAKNNLGSDFEFRPYQLNTIVEILKNHFDGVKTQVGEAPCGSGKSITGIIAAGVLWEYFQQKSYILVSDISLFDQYEEDLKRYKLNWGHLKGKNNYQCQRNGQTIPCAECSIKRVPMPVLADPAAATGQGFACAKSCKYVAMRKLAISAPVTVMTYQMWFIAMNYLKDIVYADSPESAPFQMRDFIICDEAHKIPDLVQHHFSPRIDTDDMGFLYTLKEGAEKLGFEVVEPSDMKSTAKVFEMVEKKEDIMTCIKHYEKQLATYTNFGKELQEIAAKQKDNKELLKYLSAANTARECHCKFSDYLKLIDELGLDTVICNYSEDKDGDYHIVINCAYEHKMVKKYLHDKAPNEFLMSATIGNLDIYKDMIGESDLDELKFKGFVVPSTFDYSESPIYYNDSLRMSYREKAANLPKMVKKVIEICQAHSMEHGIIQTGSYEFSSALWKALPPEIKSRVLFYKDSKQKQEALLNFEKSLNKILIGPSLIEGLNFPGDKCRFVICMKVPYASLGDKLVCAKKELINGWYANDVINKMEQSFGRGVRFNGDWCKTYILDGCFANLYKYNENDFSEITKKRLVKE